MRIKDRVVFTNEHGVQITESMVVTAYRSSDNHEQFGEALNSTGVVVEKLFNDIALSEAKNTGEQMFYFENGVKVPNHKSKVQGKKSFRSILESSETVKEFIQGINTNIAQNYDFNVTHGDINKLVGVYEAAKNVEHEENTSVDKVMTKYFGDNWANANQPITIDGQLATSNDIATWWRSGIISRFNNEKEWFSVGGYDIEIKRK